MSSENKKQKKASAMQEIVAKMTFGLHDEKWSEDQWRALLESLVEQGFSDWQELAALVLGHLNPSQVGTSLASSAGFKRRYGKGNTMRIVMEWSYAQNGKCDDCGSRLELQADHVKGREQFEDPLDADFIENMTLRCRRCNVVRRPSHNYGGQTFLTAEAALMWILLEIKPRNMFDFIRLCRIYGMTMSDIRMQEAWAMAHWLSRATPKLFDIDIEHESNYDLLQWNNGAITRADTGCTCPNEATIIYRNVKGDSNFWFLIETEDTRKKLFKYPLSFIPLSTYNLDELAPNSLAIKYTPPDRKNLLPQKLSPLPPIGLKLISHVVASDDEVVGFINSDNNQGYEAPEASRNGKLLSPQLQGKEILLKVV